MWKESGFLSEFPRGIRIKIRCGNLPLGYVNTEFFVRGLNADSAWNRRAIPSPRGIRIQSTHKKICVHIALDRFDKWGPLYSDLHGRTFCCGYIRSISYFDLPIEVNGGKSTMNPYLRHILTRCGFKIRTARILLWFFVDKILQISSTLPRLSIFGMQRKSAAYPPYVGVP